MSENQLDLFKIKESYSLINLKDLCLREIKSKYPNPVEGEDYDDWQIFIKDESDLLFAERLRAIADEIEKRVLEPQSQMIRETYDGIFK